MGGADFYMKYYEFLQRGTSNRGILYNWKSKNEFLNIKQTEKREQNEKSIKKFWENISEGSIGISF